MLVRGGRACLLPGRHRFRGRRYLVILLVGISLPLGGVAAWLVRINSIPAGLPIHFTTDHHDFGRVSVNESLIYAFEFANNARNPVSVARIKSGCGCLGYEVGEGPTLPGEKGSIVATLSTGGLNAPARLKKRIWVEFGDGVSVKTFVLSVEATILPDVIVDPEELEYLVPENRQENARCKLIVRREMLKREDFQNLRIVAPSAYYDFEISQRTVDVVQGYLEIISSKAPAHLQPIEVRYQADGVNKTIAVSLRRLRDPEGIRICPSSYVMTVGSQVKRSRLRDETTKRFRLVSGRKGAPEVVRIERLSVISDDAFAWQLGPDGPESFDLWLTRIPNSEELVSAEFVVTYRDREVESERHISFAAYLLWSSSRHNSPKAPEAASR